jgi:LPS export ABC transporter protein LptC
MLRKIVFCAVAAAMAAIPRFAAAGPDQISAGQMDNFSLSGQGEKGKTNWEVAGKSADIGAQVIKLNDVQSNLYGTNSTVHLTAQQGNLNQQSGQLHLEKDVVVTTSSGARLTTDQLDWDRKGRVVSTPSQVDLVKEDMRITAQGARAKTDLDTVDFQKDVHVRIDGAAAAEPRREPVTICCEGPLQFDYAANIAVFNNDVDVVTRDCRIQSDQMRVFFQRGKQARSADAGGLDSMKIDKIIASGNVKITRNDDVSYSEEATYTAQDRKLSLAGRPRLVIYSSEGLNAPAGN